LDIAIFLVVALERRAFARLAQYSGGVPTPARSTKTGLVEFDARESVTRGPLDGAMGKTAVL